jgi:hypothetical protein
MSYHVEIPLWVKVCKLDQDRASRKLQGLLDLGAEHLALAELAIRLHDRSSFLGSNAVALAAVHEESACRRLHYERSASGRTKDL